MRNILKLYSGTHSGTPNSNYEMVNFGSFCCGRKKSTFFVPIILIQKLVEFCQILQNLIFWKLWLILFFP